MIPAAVADSWFFCRSHGEVQARREEPWTPGKKSIHRTCDGLDGSNLCSVSVAYHGDSAAR